MECCYSSEIVFFKNSKCFCWRIEFKKEMGIIARKKDACGARRHIFYFKFLGQLVTSHFHSLFWIPVVQCIKSLEWDKCQNFGNYMIDVQIFGITWQLHSPAKFFLAILLLVRTTTRGCTGLGKRKWNKSRLGYC